MLIILAGRGKLAKALIKRFKKEKVDWVPWRTRMREPKSPRETVLIHVGSGIEMTAIKAFCTRYDIALIQGSSGMAKHFPEIAMFPAVSAPNFALDVVDFIAQLPMLAQRMKNAGILPVGIVESHQSTKTTVPGTAQRMAEILGIPPNKITSIRDQDEQLDRGIPRKHLKAHGYHWITFSGTGGKNSRIVISTQVNGREPYALGAIVIARKVIANRKHLRPGIFSTEAIMIM